MVFCGYLTIISIIVSLIILTEKILSVRIGKESCRKILHIGTILVFPLGEFFFGKGSIHFVIICAVFSIVTLVFFLSGFLENVENREKRYPGIFYYAFSLLILSLISYFNKSLSVYFGVAFIGLAIGDGFATLFGQWFKSVKIYNNKTLAGFIACIVSTFSFLLIYSWINSWFINVYEIVVISVLVAIVELVDLGLDNIIIPICAFFATYFISTSPLALIAVIIFEIIFFIGYFLKMMEYYASLTSALIGLLFYYFGGLGCLLFVVGCYIIMFLVNIVGKVLKNDLSSVVKKTGRKDFVEILVNGIWAVLAIILFEIFKNKTFLAISLIAMSEGFVDSLASDIGTLSKKRPYDIIKHKYVEKGVSGGVTILGCIASFIGALVFALGIKFVCNYHFYMIFIIAAIVFLGAVVDSILGSLVQAKFKCVVCGKITEKEVHCDKDTQLVGGCKWIDNDIVNCASGFFVFILSFVLFVF